MGTLQVCFVTSILFISIKPTEGCSQTKEFTIVYPNNPQAHETCKRCRKCPPGQGLAVQCGSRVPNGTFTGCKQCEVNKTYSENNDISHCKPCNLCGFKIVLQQCTPQQNSKCADECIPGHKLDPILDACLPETTTTTTTITTAAPSLSKRTSTTRSAGTSTPVGGIVTTNGYNSSTPDPSTEPEAVADDHGASGGSSSSSFKDQDSKHVQEIKIIVGCVVGGVLIVTVLIIIALSQGQSLCKTQSEGVAERGEKLPLREIFQADNQPAGFHNVAGRTIPLLEDQSSNTNSTTSSAGSLGGTLGARGFFQALISLVLYTFMSLAGDDQTNNLDAQQIPEDLRISDMLWLRDHDEQVMLFYVQEELDPIETRHKKTWHSVAMVLDATTKVKNIVDTSNRSMLSPTEPLIEYFKTKGDREPSMRDFVKALVICKRHEVAQNICNWPWEINVRTR